MFPDMCTIVQGTHYFSGMINLMSTLIYVNRFLQCATLSTHRINFIFQFNTSSFF
ncbi:hypothetical protein Natpe_0044 [Natrinema pellirubrum DSM 15624]|uniref:Uncharacterized protein n=1 Tax=Natrinema pellirubrum (strain DSM 15624 / CIP 106293 / JCM 10476 / NCIMB 786 / 157) TaxID=797303 RepID=L0JGL1_NATP1|nr:hypothetical protein Natpe_0044 [Natrinema pellirubrum DSM 15624]